MKKREAVLFALPLLITSCLAVPTLNDGLPRLVGHDLNYAIKYLGYPNQQMPVGNETVYSWIRDTQGTQTVTTYQPQYSYSHTPYGGINTYSNTPQTEDVSFHLLCKIHVATNKKNVITNVTFEGDNLGCEYYRSNAQKIIDDTTPKDTTKQSTAQKG